MIAELRGSPRQFVRQPRGRKAHIAEPGEYRRLAEKGYAIKPQDTTMCLTVLSDGCLWLGSRTELPICDRCNNWSVNQRNELFFIEPVEGARR